MLERLYAIFFLAPFGSPRLKAVEKARKHYHLDGSLVPDATMRFENLVGSHLLKWVQLREDTEAWQLSAGGRADYVSSEGIRVAPALALLGTLE